MQGIIMVKGLHQDPKLRSIRKPFDIPNSHWSLMCKGFWMSILQFADYRGVFKKGRMLFAFIGEEDESYDALCASMLEQMEQVKLVVPFGENNYYWIPKFFKHQRHLCREHSSLPIPPPALVHEILGKQDAGDFFRHCDNIDTTPEETTMPKFYLKYSLQGNEHEMTKRFYKLFEKARFAMRVKTVEHWAQVDADELSVALDVCERKGVFEWAFLNKVFMDGMKRKVNAKPMLSNGRPDISRITAPPPPTMSTDRDGALERIDKWRAMQNGN